MYRKMITIIRLVNIQHLTDTTKALTRTFKIYSLVNFKHATVLAIVIMLHITSPGLMYHNCKFVPFDHLHLIPLLPPPLPSGRCSKFLYHLTTCELEIISTYYLHLSSRLLSPDGEMKFGVVKWLATQYGWGHPDRKDSHPKFVLYVKTGDAMNTPTGYEKIYHSYHEASWGEQGWPLRLFENVLRPGKGDWLGVFMMVRG